MKSTIYSLTMLLIAASIQPVSADFGGPDVARHALSPDGQLLVRIKTAKRDLNSKAAPKHKASFYEYDKTADGYVRQSDFTLTGKLGQMLYVSNAGDLILISLGEKDTIRLYSRAGTLAKSWDLKEILSKDEIQSCAKTGATLQWIDEGSFHDRTFYCHGPSRLIRALKPPYTVLRGANVKVTFSATLNAENARLTKHASDQ